VVFSDEPVEVALKWQSRGAPRLHIVDLDGAAEGKLRNQGIIEELASAILIPIQVGGGIREMEVMERLLKAGVDRVILGTAAVENPALVEEACRKFSESVIVGIDTREGLVSTRGWQHDTKISGVELAKSMVRFGVRRFIHTDIGRGSTLTEPNFTAVAELVDTVKVSVIAAGGVSSLLHLKMLSQLGVEGAIVGKALYTGDINLKQALEGV
jgi:phosphoribosylformimino-5-aminoimidazole carboxamide ribotide isomerase